MLVGMVRTPRGARLHGFPRLQAGDGTEWLGMKVFLTLMAASGFRKADIALDSGVPFGRRHLSLYFVRWHIGGQWVEAPERGMQFTTSDR
eukprot:4170493-Pleurochrysis_carterae.AAC.1